MKESINWYWTPDLKIVRNVAQQNGIIQVQECSDVAYLEAEQEILETKRQEWFEGANIATNTIRKVYFQELLKEVDYQLEYVEQRLSELREPTELLEQSTPIVEVVQSSNLSDTDELTHEEARDRGNLERKVERAFYEAGKALQELRERRLYRNTHKTFESYCQERFGHSRQKANFLIAGAKAYDNLTTNCCQTDPENLTTNGTQTETETQMTTNGCQNQDESPISLTTNRAQNPEVEMTTNGLQTEMAKMTTNGTQILPTSEGQVRPLTKLEPDQQREAWQKAVEQAGGKVPSGRIVKSIVDQIRERNPVPNPWRVNEVAMIMVKDNPELRGKGGCWCVITEVHNFSCTVRLWDGDYQVKPENLKELPYSNEQQEMVRKLCDRLTKIYHAEMEDTAKAVLASLGRIDRPWLTEIESGLLTFLEGNLKTDNG
ncbi:MAG: hypothetical protein MK111_22695 [Crocosphaera sp.]|uniref:Benzoyl-CoA reductase/2-hydroxyglutaryl-CoA dehydratase subunit, BcrC/BadD/HgdB n=3 Tax=Crocosphaera watsonii TaxID=263511 RepID=T2JZS5_CROWT|nr:MULTISPECIES: hypothetical protein [Crocosphaera]EHJ10132.1 hypothetical protein CWATWH0003_5114 [Crocosphaera watsonii WH 0003]MCH2247405.1 hypothetical protein [Crocosphaera sp.]CCQ56423.1 Benzoyl-CoA reductase/2-hydroxyglutaryl-CoA dehydratase subunit, BcrC/BadD/HgdB [Crocosphaera watsonii WH 0005]CCQ70576.1 hypothetical protein CWATWH0402_5441 [Crocosphaera watsonii WH 0402]